MIYSILYVIVIIICLYDSNNNNNNYCTILYAVTAGRSPADPEQKGPLPIRPGPAHVGTKQNHFVQEHSNYRGQTKPVIYKDDNAITHTTYELMTFNYGGPCSAVRGKPAR